MSTQLNFKVLLMTAIYLLHVSCFDKLMARGSSHNPKFSLWAATHKMSKKKSPLKHSYRLLAKHSKELEADVRIPAIDNNTSDGLVSAIPEPLQLLTQVSSVHPDAVVSDLYQLYKVLLI
jgi:hypothetical protein